MLINSLQTLTGLYIYIYVVYKLNTILLSYLDKELSDRLNHQFDSMLGIFNQSNSRLGMFIIKYLVNLIKKKKSIHIFYHYNSIN